jgi:signal transduction histidine kinase
MNKIQKKIFKLGRVENFEVKNHSLIFLFMAPTFFGWSYFIHNYGLETSEIPGARIFFCLLFLLAGILPLIYKRKIHLYYGWIVFLVIIIFSHFAIINLYNNQFNIGFLLGFYAVVFGSVLLFNNRVFINIYLVSVFVHLIQSLLNSQIDVMTFNAVLSSFSLMFIFALILLNDSAAYRYYLANNNRVLEKSKIELKKRAEDLQEKNNDLEEFSGIVSHDLKTPLRNILALSNWLREDAENKNTTGFKENLTLLEKQIIEMELIIEGVLNYSLQNEVTSNIEQIDLDLLINDLVTLSEIDKCEITIKNKLPFVKVNKSQILQVFQNLIQNSIKYNDKEVCEIEIDCTQNNDFYTFSVKDNGIGIDEKYHEKIFKLFQRLEAKKDPTSTGIGLAMVKKIINRNKGEIYLESQVNIGATFYFTLPV